MRWGGVATVEYIKASCSYPDNKRKAVDNLTLSVADGEFLVLLGPSGCGKTTALRMLAGLEPLQGGEILVDGEDIDGLPPGERDLAMVFQNYALFPHMTVARNLGFRMELAGAPPSAVSRRVRRVAAELGLSDRLDRLPRTLSGGEQQRVAIGRAMVREPRVFLMDEPLGALDAKLRASARARIAEMQRKTGTTTLYVTHDQVEAMAMGDRIAIMNRGMLQQVDSPRQLYDRPANEFVAGFVGSPAMNLVPGTYKHGWALIGEADVFEIPVEVAKPLTSSSVLVGFRPEHATITAPGTGIYATVGVVELLGHTAYAHCEMGVGRGRRTLIVRCEMDAAPPPGAHVGVMPDPREIHLFDGETGMRVGR
ncbi:diacetylchitobiose ABC transporter ATP-binding protein MsiK [Catenulispora yoronensis]|uniref:Diacetylchitobiose ABC transporter ATP-binding protein MsiK n=1 Tax=Catenulispora yoronensis TaxID=450799 RepID=A0ABN2VFI7_9ACTN